MAPRQEIPIRAIGTALAGMSMAFAVYMLAYGGGKTRTNGLEHLAIFAQPRGSAVGTSPPGGPVSPIVSKGAAVDMAATASFAPSPGDAMRESRPIEIVAARAERVWLRIDGALRSAVPGDSVPGVGRIGAIVARDGGWVLLDDKGAALLAVTKGANGAALFARNRIFE
ncbi:MAG TPA: hypothetical protein VF886_06290 [Roseiarcus sp.]